MKVSLLSVCVDVLFKQLTFFLIFFSSPFPLAAKLVARLLYAAKSRAYLLFWRENQFKLCGINNANPAVKKNFPLDF